MTKYFRPVTAPVAIAMIAAGAILLLFTGQYEVSKKAKVSVNSSEMGWIETSTGSGGSAELLILMVAAFGVWLVLAGVYGSPQPLRGVKLATLAEKDDDRDPPPTEV